MFQLCSICEDWEGQVKAVIDGVPTLVCISCHALIPECMKQLPKELTGLADRSRTHMRKDPLRPGAMKPWVKSHMTVS